MIHTAEAINRAYHEEWTALLATLAGQLRGDVGLAEEAVADAFAAAVAEWPTQGVPSRPGAWLTTVARRRAIDRMRREATRSRALDHLETLMRDDDGAGVDPLDQSGVADDKLRLLFTCCHPALALETRVALTLQGHRRAGGLRGISRIADHRDHDVPAARPREAEAQGCRDSVPGSLISTSYRIDFTAYCT